MRHVWASFMVEDELGNSQTHCSWLLFFLSSLTSFLGSEKLSYNHDEPTVSDSPGSDIQALMKCHQGKGTRTVLVNVA